MNQAWNDDSWSQFIDRHWERCPVKLPAPAWAQFCSLKELFEIMVASRKSERLVSDRFWVAREKMPKRLQDFVMVSLDLLGPQPSDNDLNGFFKRMQGRSFGINLHRLDRWQSDLGQSFAEPMERLTQVPGVEPVKHWELDCFLGTYRMTPFGVHRDRASVFSLCLKGERTYLTWPPDYCWPEGDLFVPDESRLKRHLGTAERFQIGPGELFYWPSNRWHVVCSDGRPSVVVQISGYLGRALTADSDVEGHGTTKKTA